MTRHRSGWRRTGLVTVVVAAMAAVLPVAAGAGPAGTVGAATRTVKPLYGLALGDWFATGIGASAGSQDYVNLVAGHEATRFPNLQVVDLGCGGATTASMVDGPGCSYTTGTQLGDAEAFLESHLHQVAYVTIDIGADDVAGCQSSSGIDVGCAAAGMSQIATELPRILTGLRAAGPGVPVYGMNYDDPFLASWLTGAAGQSVATQSLTSTDQLNATLEQIYSASGVATADAASQFATDDTDLVGSYQGATVPEDVAEVCASTYACTGGGDQPNDQGYAHLAAAFEQVIDRVTVDTSGLPVAAVKTAYSGTLGATGGNGPYRWSVVGGSLPAGLRLQARSGRITGKAKVVGVATFTVRVGDTRDTVKPVTQDSGTATLSLQVVAAPAGMPASGLYATPQYAASQVTEHTVQFSSAPGPDGVVGPLFMDIFTGPDAATAARPTLVQIHGGAFVSGDRTESDGDAQLTAEYGYVGVTIDYRLVSVADAGGPNEAAVAAAATLDAQQAVRFLKANASTYGVDPDRIALLGNSAGGSLALGAAVAADVPYSGPLAGYSPSIAAAVSTGAYLTPALGELSLDASDAPSLMFMYEYDTGSHVTAAYAFQTCDALRAAGDACAEVEQAGTGHTTSLSAGGQWWTGVLGPFLWDELRLSTAPH